MFLLDSTKWIQACHICLQYFLECLYYFMAVMYSLLSVYSQLSSWPPWCHQMLLLSDLWHNGKAYIRVERLWYEMTDVLMHWENWKPVKKEIDSKQFSEKTEGRRTVEDGAKEKLVWGGDRRQKKRQKGRLGFSTSDLLLRYLVLKGRMDLKTPQWLYTHQNV